MIIFLFPQTLGNEIQRIVNSYWWDSSHQATKGMNWLAWDILCALKEDDGVSSNLNKYFPMLWIMGAYIKMPGEWNIICIMPMFLQAYFGGSVESVSLIQRVMKPCSTESNVEEEAHEC
ncbi:hypothetical protein GLYMA_03G051550v4 [Glycine max]|nr:hypothetical protein GLYMA_03G051550v4 [Glycine max]KAH1068628.1 hypothetical protein GYH30_006277 [Glycine max]